MHASFLSHSLTHTRAHSFSFVWFPSLELWICVACGYAPKVYWPLSLPFLLSSILLYLFSFHFIFVFSIWFNLMWSIQYLFFHHLSIYLSTAHSLSFSSFISTRDVCVFRSFCVCVCVCFGWLWIALRVFANLTCLRINHMSYDISHTIYCK